MISELSQKCCLSLSEMVVKKSKYTPPDSVVNKTLYKRIKSTMDREHKEAGKRWGAYSSGELVRRYKKAGGKYRGSKPKSTGTSRWFKEKWVDIAKLPKIVPCGRSKFSPSGKTFPYCRPLYRVSAKTPKTVKELTKKEIASRIARKKANPRSTITK